MRTLVFDAGPIITLTLNHLMWTLSHMQKDFGGKFYIPEAVRRELIDRPLEINRFKFEALHTNRYVKKGTITVYPIKEYEKMTQEIMDLANAAFIAHENPIRIVHAGEIQVIALALILKSDAVVIDERTAIELIEHPDNIRQRLSKRLHTRVSVDQQKLEKLKDMLEGLHVIRSADIMVVAYEKGLLDRYLPEEPYDIGILLDAVLWGLKLNGCTIAKKEIESIVRHEMERRKR